jgi:hypothetical protein
MAAPASRSVSASQLDALVAVGEERVGRAGDARCGSTKRCAAAVGEGSMAVQFVHKHLAATTVRVG